MKKNPLLNHKDWETPFSSVPFEEIELEHIIPAIEEGIRRAKDELEVIKLNDEEPTFENTIFPMLIGDRLLDIANSIFNVLSESSSTKGLREIEEEVKKKIVDFNLQTSSDKVLFERIKVVYDERNDANLSVEEKTIVENIYKGFIRSGIDLEGEKRVLYEEASSRLAKLLIAFKNNILEESENGFVIVDSLEDLSGLPDDTIEFCKKTANEKGIDGFVITLNPRFVRLRILPYLDSRELRKKMWARVGSICCRGGKTDNSELIKEIIYLRLTKSSLLGFESFSDYVLEESMAKNKESVFNFMEELKEKSLPIAKKEVSEVSEFAKSLSGKDFVLMPWDFSYYSEKLREEKYSFNEKEVQEYFPLDSVRAGVFNLVKKMYGLSFRKIPNIQTWNPSVEVYGAFDSENGEEKFKGLIYFDLFMRPNDEKKDLPQKGSGAWMMDFIAQENNSKRIQQPHIQMAMNLMSQEKGKPVLMSIDEVTTYLHEFGHVLHGLLSDVHYADVSGTSVFRDFVELPSQFMENFFYEQEYFLREASSHYITQEPLPEELFQKIENARKFNLGAFCLRQTSFSMIDMGFHSITEGFEENVLDFEESILNEILLFSDVEEKVFTSTQFEHIFGGGYASGYYSYKWAEVLDADAFEFVKENKFSKEVFSSFRKNILEKGGSEDPAVLYEKFRGKMPTSDAMFRRDGIL